MKILFVGSSNTINLFRLGGVETIIKELSLFLKKQKHCVTIYQIDKMTKGSSKIKTDFGTIKIYYGTIFNIRTKLLANNFDIINFVQTPFENPFFTVLFLIKKCLSKTITTKFFFTYPPFRKYKFFEVVKYKLLIDKCFVFSKRLQAEIKSISKNVHFLYPAVSDYFFNLKTKRKHGNKISIMYTGRLSQDKGLDQIIDIYQSLDREKYALSIIGYFSTEWDKKKYEKKLKSLSVDRLTILQSRIKSTDGLYPPLDHCDILLLPYQNLSPTVDLPLLVLEGMVAGCKVVTSCIGNIPFLKGNIYCVKDFNNSQAFIKTINNIADKKVEESDCHEFSTENIGTKYLSFVKLKTPYPHSKY